MESKKGIETHEVVIKLAMAAIALIIVVSFLVIVFRPQAGGSVGDNICRFSLSVRGAGSGPFKEIEQSRPGGIIPKAPRFCKTQLIKIKPDDWGKCDSAFLSMSYNTEQRGEAVRGCAAQQIAELLWRCWRMNGEGAWNPDSWICFRAGLVGELEPGKFGEKNIQEEYERRLDCELCKSKEEAEKSNCDERKLKLKVQQEYNTHDRCTAVVNALSGPLTTRAIWDAITQYHVDGLKDAAENCARRTEGMTDEKYAKYKSELSDEFTHKVISQTQYAALPEDQRKDYIVYDSVYQNSLGTKIDEKLGASVCAGMVKNLKDHAFPNKFKSEEGSAQALNEVREKAKMYLESTDMSSGAQDTAQQITDLAAPLVQVTSKLPDFASIDEAYLQKIMKEHKILGSLDTYASVLPATAFKMLKEYEVTKNSLFEVGFCDPNMGDILSGVGAIFDCTADSVLKGKLLAGQQILIAKAGMFTAATGSRTENPIPELCQLFNMHITDRFWFTDWRGFCRGVVQGALGTERSPRSPY